MLRVAGLANSSTLAFDPELNVLQNKNKAKTKGMKKTEPGEWVERLAFLWECRKGLP